MPTKVVVSPDGRKLKISWASDKVAPSNEQMSEIIKQLPPASNVPPEPEKFDDKEKDDDYITKRIALLEANLKVMEPQKEDLKRVWKECVDKSRFLRRKAKAERYAVEDKFEVLSNRKKLHSQKAELEALERAQKEIDDKFVVNVPQVLEEKVAELYDKFKKNFNPDSLIGYNEADPEWERTIVRGQKFAKENYNPFSRERDKEVLLIADSTCRGKLVHEQQMQRLVIQRVADEFSKLRVPVKTKVRFEQDRGKLNQRDIWRVAVRYKEYQSFMEQTKRLAPNAAITVLVDCSGSMKPVFSHVRKSALALNLAMKKLNIPHEILGYSTSTEEAYDHPGPGFSRWVPVKNYIFKNFDSPDVSSIFLSTNDEFKMHDGVDGESLLWAAQRLGKREERTKIIIYLTDSQPSCSRAEDVCAPIFGVEGEIRKHFWLACKQIESTPIHLWGVGICTSAAADFFKNHLRLDKVEDMPMVLTKIITGVLKKTGLH